MENGLRFKQIISAAWKNDSGDLTYSLYGLTEDGRVYRNTKGGWVAEIMEEKLVSAPRSQPAARRNSGSGDNDVPW